MITFCKPRNRLFVSKLNYDLLPCTSFEASEGSTQKRLTTLKVMDADSFQQLLAILGFVSCIMICLCVSILVTNS